MRSATLLDGCRIDEKAREAFASTRRTLREQQLRAAKAVLLHPPLKDLLLEGRLTLDAAAEFARVFGDPRVEAVHTREQWISFAGTESAKASGSGRTTSVARASACFLAGRVGASWTWR